MLKAPLLTVVNGDTLSCHTDRFGAHPVYVLATPRAMMVAAAQRSLVRYTDGPDVRRYPAALLGDDVPLLRKVRRVAPGAMLDVREHRVLIRVFRRRPPLSPDGMSPDDLAVDLGQRLFGAVERQLGEHPAHLTLSGGLDSAGLLAITAPHGAVAWSLDDAASCDELPTARELAARFGAEHRVLSVDDRDLVDAFEGCVVATESLIFNGRAVARHLLLREMARHRVKAFLSGVGADEIFMGNPATVFSVPRPDRDRACMQGMLRVAGPQWAFPAEAGPETIRAWHLANTLAGATLPPEARAAGAAGIDVLLPYLDDAVVARGMGLRHEHLVYNGLGKRVLRDVFVGLLPDSVRLRPKTPRITPPGRARAAWEPLFDALLSNERLRNLQVVHIHEVRRLLATWARGEGDLAQKERVLMRLASLSVLAERFK